MNRGSTEVSFVVENKAFVQEYARLTAKHGEIQRQHPVP